MRKSLYLIAALAIVVMLLAACGGGGGGSKPPVDMQKYESETFTMDFPKAWQKSSMDMMGLGMAFFSTKEFKAEDLSGLDMASMVSENPLVITMFVPQALAGSMGLDDLDAAMESTDIGDDVEVIKEGDVTLDGAKGKIMIAKGTDPDIGKMGAHVVMAKKDDGTTIIFMGITPEQDLDKNLKIFEYMQNTFKFK